jgi:excisionase family DNA binding protein
MEPIQPKNLSRSQAAVFLGLSLSSIDRALRSKTIPSFRLGRRVLIPINGLEALERAANEAFSAKDLLLKETMAEFKGGGKTI